MHNNKEHNIMIDKFKFIEKPTQIGACFCIGTDEMLSHRPGNGNNLSYLCLYDDYGKSNGKAKETAELICEAVNNYSKLKEQNDKLIERLKECVLQIEYLHKKFNETASGNAVLGRNYSLLNSIEKQNEL